MLRTIPVVLATFCSGLLAADGGPAAAPAVSCTVEGRIVHLTWTAPAGATVQGYVVYRNRDTAATLPATALSLDDAVPKAGSFVYRVVASTGKRRAVSVGACEVAIDCFGLTAKVDGLKVTLSWSPPDGVPAGVTPKYIVSRNGEAVGAPVTDTTLVDTVPAPDHYAYKVVADLGGTAPVLIASCKVDVPPGDIPPPAGLACKLDLAAPRSHRGGAASVPQPSVALSWTDPADYATVLVSLDGEVIARLRGDAEAFEDIGVEAGKHSYEVTGVLKGGWKSPAASCEVTLAEPPPPLGDLTCAAKQGSFDAVELAWTVPAAAAYTSIAVYRNGEKIADLPVGAGPAAVSYEDKGLKAGTYTYAVAGFTADSVSAAATCKVKVLGPPARNVLYFSSSHLDRSSAAPGNKLVCLASNSAGLQGWSFGVRSDPSHLVTSKADTDGTETDDLKPEFLRVDVLPDGSGVTMAVILSLPKPAGGDAAAPPVLPVGYGHSLLNIEYAAGPDAVRGKAYQVHYSDKLGDPPVKTLFVVDGAEKSPESLPGFAAIAAENAKFRRGDVDGNGKVDFNDALSLLDWLFPDVNKPGTKPACLEAADANGSGSVNAVDAIYLLFALYVSGPKPPAPFPDCGEAPAPLGCDDPGPCKGQ